MIDLAGEGLPGLAGLLGDAVRGFHQALGVFAQGFEHDFDAGHSLVGRFTEGEQLLTERLAGGAGAAGDLFRGLGELAQGLAHLLAGDADLRRAAVGGVLEVEHELLERIAEAVEAHLGVVGIAGDGFGALPQLVADHGEGFGGAQGCLVETAGLVVEAIGGFLKALVGGVGRGTQGVLAGLDRIEHLLHVLRHLAATLDSEATSLPISRLTSLVLATEWDTVSVTWRAVISRDSRIDSSSLVTRAESCIISEEFWLRMSDMERTWASTCSDVVPIWRACWASAVSLSLTWVVSVLAAISSSSFWRRSVSRMLSAWTEARLAALASCSACSRTRAPTVSIFWMTVSEIWPMTSARPMATLEAFSRSRVARSNFSVTRRERRPNSSALAARRFSTRVAASPTPSACFFTMLSTVRSLATAPSEAALSSLVWIASASSTIFTRLSTRSITWSRFAVCWPRRMLTLVAWSSMRSPAAASSARCLSNRLARPWALPDRVSVISATVASARLAASSTCSELEATALPISLA